MIHEAIIQTKRSSIECKKEVGTALGPVPKGLMRKEPYNIIRMYVYIFFDTSAKSFLGGGERHHLGLQFAILMLLQVQSLHDERMPTERTLNISQSHLGNNLGMLFLKSSQNSPFCTCHFYLLKPLEVIRVIIYRLRFQ